MDFQYNYNDRLEDAGERHDGYQNTEGYIFNMDEQPKHKTVGQRIKHIAIAAVQLLVK